jgi:hypothetical protein
MRAIGIFFTALAPLLVAIPYGDVHGQAVTQYHGSWSGNWISDRGGGSGQVKMLIQAAGANAAYTHISLTNAVVPGFSKEIRYQKGSMVVDDNRVTMTFTVSGSQMSVSYRNKDNGDHGRYSLTRER